MMWVYNKEFWATKEQGNSTQSQKKRKKEETEPTNDPDVGNSRQDFRMDFTIMLNKVNENVLKMNEKIEILSREIKLNENCTI